MTWRFNLILLAVAVSLTVYYRAFEAAPASWETAGLVFATLEAQEVVEIELSRPATSSDAEHGADVRLIGLRYESVADAPAAWWVTTPIRSPAFHPRARGLASNLADMVRVGEAGENADALMGAVPVLRVSFKTRSGGGGVVEFGPEHADPSLRMCYARVDGGDVFVTTIDTRDGLRASLTDLRSRAVFPLAKEDATRVNVRRMDASALAFERVRDGELWSERWRLTEPYLAVGDRGRIAELLDTLNAWTILDYVADDVPAAKLAEYGLDKPRVELRVEAKDGRVVEVVVGADVPAPSADSEEAPENRRVYVLRRDLPHVFSASHSVFTQLRLGADHFRGRYVFDFDVDEVVGIEAETLRKGLPPRSMRARRLEISTETRRDGTREHDGRFTWRVEDRLGPPGESFTGDRTLFDELLRDLRRLPIEKFLAPSELEATGLVGPGGPRSSVTIELGSGRKETVLVGDRSTDELDQNVDVYFLRRSNEKGGILVETKLPRLVEVGAAAFRRRDLSELDPSDVLELSLRRGDQRWSLSRVPGQKTWDLPASATLAPGLRLDSKLVDELVLQLHRDVFRVAQYLPDADRAPAAWTVQWEIGIRTPDAARAVALSGLQIGDPHPGTTPLEYTARLPGGAIPPFTIGQELPDALRRLQAHLQAILTE